jgi:hypothetical protein
MKIRRSFIALVLSALFPGFGQIYNRQYNKGIFYICFKLVINTLRREPLEILLEARKAGDITVDSSIVLIVVAYTIADIVLWINGIIDAKRNAENLEKKMQNEIDEK